MMETRLSHLLFGSSYFARVTFGGDSDVVNVWFGSDTCPDSDNDLELDDLNTLIHMLFVARDELESRQPTNKETE
jgi:hypothetical protein